MADALKFCILRKFYKKVLERTICAKFVNGGGGDNISPLSKIPENGRLGLSGYTMSGLKLQKNPNQFYMNS